MPITLTILLAKQLFVHSYSHLPYSRAGLVGGDGPGKGVEIPLRLNVGKTNAYCDRSNNSEVSNIYFAKGLNPVSAGHAWRTVQQGSQKSGSIRYEPPA